MTNFDFDSFRCLLAEHQFELNNIELHLDNVIDKLFPNNLIDLHNKYENTIKLTLASAIAPLNVQSVQKFQIFDKIEVFNMVSSSRSDLSLISKLPNVDCLITGHLPNGNLAAFDTKPKVKQTLVSHSLKALSIDIGVDFSKLSNLKTLYLDTESESISHHKVSTVPPSVTEMSLTMKPKVDNIQHTHNPFC
ncbi:unnamed protein product [Ambrosiozyma monospora]|uniref:Unnamed protein product n=1 Tax=Ambrosiozyma monospora TaxID=43982 RepID=A0ACB5TTB4_AMBMO|nr:unnamed protein product [Ambrosiozyma monospora]